MVTCATVYCCNMLLLFKTFPTLLAKVSNEKYEVLAFYVVLNVRMWAVWRSRYSDWLQAGRSGDRMPLEKRFSAPAQIGPGAHPASCAMGTGSFRGVKSGRGVTLTPHTLLVPWSRKGRAIPLFPLWVVRPVHSLSACTRVHFTFTFYM